MLTGQFPRFVAKFIGKKAVFAKQITRNFMLLSLTQALIRAKWMGLPIIIHFSILMWIVGQKLQNHDVRQR